MRLFTWIRRKLTTRTKPCIYNANFGRVVPEGEPAFDYREGWEATRYRWDGEWSVRRATKAEAIARLNEWEDESR